MKRYALLLIAGLVMCRTSESADAGTIGPGAHPLAAHKLGAGLNDSGIATDDSGSAAMSFVAPVTNPLTGQVVGSCNPMGFFGDFNTCVLTSSIACGEHKIQSTAQLSPAQCIALFNLIKAGANAQLADAGVAASFQ